MYSETKANGREKNRTLATKRCTYEMIEKKNKIITNQRPLAVKCTQTHCTYFYIAWIVANGIDLFKAYSNEIQQARNKAIHLQRQLTGNWW